MPTTGILTGYFHSAGNGALFARIQFPVCKYQRLPNYFVASVCFRVSGKNPGQNYPGKH
jgi:hypothetical protein